MHSNHSWSFGDHLVYRETVQGRVWTARPVTVICDTPELVALYLHNETIWKRCTPVEPGEDLVRCKANRAAWQLEEARVELGNTVILIYGTDAHATHIMWNTAQQFTGWYVNFQEALRRTATGFDFLDQELDLVVQPDGALRWKDVEHLALAEALGLFSPVQCQSIRAEAERVAKKVRARAEPFDGSWLDWRPPAQWSVPSLPAGWDQIRGD
jgi:hypothetical protein